MATSSMSSLPRRATLLALASLAALALLASPAAQDAEAKAARGIDVSRFQGTINWQKVSETNVGFAFVQASRGDGGDCLVAPDDCGADPYWPANYIGAHSWGIPVGAYHRAFASGANRRKARKDARAEARLFSSEVGVVAPGDLIPVLDVETPFTDLDPARLRLWIKIWMRSVERRLGVKPIIYTNNSSWQATGNTTRFATRGHLLWVANYGVSEPLVPADWWAGLGWTVWQYTSSGRVRGISGPVDENRLAGELATITAP
jgi:lysozyme